MSQDFLKDVKPDPSAGSEEPIEEVTEPVEPVEDPKVDDPERPVENVRRELSRKQDKFQDEVSTAISQLAQGQVEMQHAITGFISSKPEQKTGNKLDDMSIQELRSLRTEVAESNPDKLPEFDVYMTDRMVDERVDARMSEFKTVNKVDSLRNQANDVATARYPELSRDGSQFRNAVNVRLNELGDAYVNNNPRAVLDAANDVSAEMGLAPATPRPNTQMQSRIAGTRTQGAPEQTIDVGGLPVDDTELDKIATRLQDAMPPGKTFDKKAMKENMKSYGDNKQLFLRG
jgi:hypothetical protein